MKKAAEKPASVRLGQDLENEVARLSEELDMPRSQIIRKAVRHFVARQKHIDLVLSAARQSYARYQATGRGVPWEESERWLRAWGTKDETPAPAARNTRS